MFGNNKERPMGRGPSLRENFEIADLKIINFTNLIDEEKEVVRSWRNHPDVSRWMYDDHQITAEEHARFIEKLVSDEKKFFWLVKDAVNGAVGVIYLNRVDRHHQNAYLGIYANPDNPAKGKGQKLFQGLTFIAFEQARLHTMLLEVLADNERALNFYAKVGLKEVGRLPEYVYRDNKFQDVVIMSIINPQKV